MASRSLTLMSIISGNGRAGSDQLAFNISKGLKNKGHRMIWGCPPDCYLIDDARKAGLEIFNISRSGPEDMTVVPALVDFCKEERVDIVNVHHSYARHMILSARFRGPRPKIVFTRHSLSREIPLLGKFFYNFFVDMNICVSNLIRKSLILGGVWPRRAVTVYGGVDIDKFENVPAEEIRKARERYADRRVFTIGIVARFPSSEHFNPKNPTIKGHDVLFGALAGLGEDFNLLVIGPWKERDIESAKLLAHYKGLDLRKITFCGYKEDMTPFYKIMDLNVLPSLNEGLGLSIIEAMASGTACIGASSGGIREIISDGVNGLLFRPGKSRDLMEKIRLIIENEELRSSFIARGKETARKMFDIERNVLETEQIFYNLLAS